MNVNFVTTQNSHNGYGMLREQLPKYLAKYGIILDTPDAGNDVTFILNLPPAIVHAKSPIKVLYTMLEGDQVPDSWREFLLQATHILVPTQFVKETFKKAGFDTTVIPLGYDADVFKFHKRKKENNPFVFLHYEAFQDRKGWQDLLEAWNFSLAENEFDAKLILKTIKPFKEVYERLKDLQIELPFNVRVICGELPHHSMYDLLCEADCFVFPSRGEGFSMTPLEAMATGCPTILTAAHSHLDYYNEEYMYGVKCDIKVPAVYSHWEDQGNFVRCTTQDLAKALTTVYDNKEIALHKGTLAAEYVKRFTIENSCKAVGEFLCQLQEKPVSQT